MKLFLKKILFTFIILISVFLLGLTPSLLVSSFVIIFTDTTFQDCIEFVPFWIITFIGWIAAASYINEESKNIEL